MHPPGADTVVVRYGDLTTKSASVARRMRDELAAHLRSLLSARDLPGDVRVAHSRTYVHLAASDRLAESDRTEGADDVANDVTAAESNGADPTAVEAVARAAADAFGVVSASPARRVEPTLEAIEAALAEAATAHYDGGSFAVDANRAYPGHAFTSEDVEESGGSAIWAAAEDAGVEPAVDLDDPDVVFEVDVREDDAYVFLDRVEGPGGFPFGSQAPLVALVSGGIDSPVAAYEAMARGSPLVPVYLDLGDYGGPDHEARAVQTVRRLAWYAPGRDWTLFRVPAGDSVAAIADAMERGRMLAFRRYMFGVADEIADAHDAAGVVTGEALGQKSSQTASNLQVTSAAVDRPIHRPLFAWDKHEITERARELGTFRESTIPAGCNRFAPEHPETEGTLRKLREEEPDELFEWAREDARNATMVDVEPEAPRREY